MDPKELLASFTGVRAENYEKELLQYAGDKLNSLLQIMIRLLISYPEDSGSSRLLKSLLDFNSRTANEYRCVINDPKFVPGVSVGFFLYGEGVFSEQFLEALKNSGADPTAADRENNTPLHVLLKAASCTSSYSSPYVNAKAREPVTFVIDWCVEFWQRRDGAENPFNKKNRAGNTPLHFAVYAAILTPLAAADYLPRLLGLGADPSILNEEGRTSFDIAFGMTLNYSIKHVVSCLVTLESYAEDPSGKTVLRRLIDQYQRCAGNAGRRSYHFIIEYLAQAGYLVEGGRAVYVYIDKLEYREARDLIKILDREGCQPGSKYHFSNWVSKTDLEDLRAALRVHIYWPPEDLDGSGSSDEKFHDFVANVDVDRESVGSTHFLFVLSEPLRNYMDKYLSDGEGAIQSNQIVSCSREPGSGDGAVVQTVSFFCDSSSSDTDSGVDKPDNGSSSSSYGISSLFNNS